MAAFFPGNNVHYLKPSSPSFCELSSLFIFLNFKSFLTDTWRQEKCAYFGVPCTLGYHVLFQCMKMLKYYLNQARVISTDSHSGIIWDPCSWLSPSSVHHQQKQLPCSNSTAERLAPSPQPHSSDVRHMSWDRLDQFMPDPQGLCISMLPQHMSIHVHLCAMCALCLFSLLLSHMFRMPTTGSRAPYIPYIISRLFCLFANTDWIKYLGERLFFPKYICNNYNFNVSKW